MKVGVLALQGDVEEHLGMLQKCGAEAVRVRNADEIEGISALIIPGGESTTIAKLVWESGIADALRKRVAEKHFPVWGTCAGLVLMAKKGDAEVRRRGQKLLGLMDFEVNRNAFGRQRESFEANVDVGRIRGFHAYFIRAPAISKVWGGCKVLARFDGRIVAAEQGNLLATAFHPELGEDARMHEYFLNKIRQK